MGYYTDYTLELSDHRFEHETIELLKQVTQYHWDNLQLFGVKWYDHEKDMIKISRTIPEVTFTLYGNGEEADDRWVHYFRRGNHQRFKAVITFPPCDLE